MEHEKSIVLASVLKPTDDVRMYAKFGISLSKVAKAVHLVGFHAQAPADAPANCHFHGLYQFPRASKKRWLASWRFYRLLRQLAPDMVLVHAVELLPFACWYAFWHKIPLYYDVQENYAMNIRHQQVYAWWAKHALAGAIRLAEWASRWFVAHYFLAEHCYAAETAFMHGKYTVLENKCLPAAILPKKEGAVRGKRPLQLAYTGTISEVYGIREAVSFAISLTSHCEVRLHIVGKLAGEGLREWLQERASQHPFIALEISDDPMPHWRLMEALTMADFALLPYRPNPSTANCMPTKLFECLATGTPMIYTPNALWERQVARYSGGLPFDFSQQPDIQFVVRLFSENFYPQGSAKDVFWEEEPLLSAICSQAPNYHPL